MRYGNRIQMDPMIVVACNSSGFEGKTRQLGQCHPKRTEGATKQHKGGQQLAHPGPHRGDPTSSRFISEFRPGGFLHAPSCGLTSSRPGFTDMDYPRKSCETTWQYLPGGGASAPA
jgi:hypothetical protein